MRLSTRGRLIVFVVSVCLLGVAMRETLTARDDAPVKVALLESVFSGQSREKIVEQIKPFADIIQKETGTKAVFDVMSLAQAEGDFKSGKIQLVILTGLEYAWLHAQDPDTKALLVAGIDPGATRTVFIVKQDDTAKEVKDLQGATLSVPEKVPYLSQFYVNKVAGQPLDKAFKLMKNDNVDDTIEAVLDGKARGAMVTGAGFDVFKERKPGRAKKLKVIHESPDFPPATVMYHEKQADKAALEKFKKALLGANDKPEGSRVLTLFKLKGFETLPEGFEKQVTETAKGFPRSGG
ncbi:MAG: PhnD/SsuA/transferrin family substrate-binding protein [Gemmatales bacterium]